jgi:hypothetical protein
MSIESVRLTGILPWQGNISGPDSKKLFLASPWKKECSEFDFFLRIK